MAKGNYIVSPILDNKDILFELSPAADKDIPIEQQNLLFDVQEALEIIRTVYKVDNRLFANYFDQLLKLSQVGLVGENAQPQMAKRALEQLKTEVTNREGGKVKNKYLKELGYKAMLFGLPTLIIGVILNYLHCKNIDFDCLNCVYFANLLILWAGTMIGVWLSFAITNLTIIEKDRLEPSLRLLFTGILALSFGLLFLKKAIVINLGDLSSLQIATDPISSYLLGVILGLNEKIIGNTLTKKTAKLFEN